MGRLAKILMAICLLALIAIFGWQMMRTKQLEPLYQGKGLRSWLWEYHWGYEVAATNAVRQIGTNAIPSLLEMLRKTDAPLESKFIGLWNWLHRHIWPMRWLPAAVQFPMWYRNQASIQHDDAALAFAILGPDAERAVPDLIKIYDQRPDSQADVRQALAFIKPQAHAAIALFMREASGTDELIRIDAIKTLGRIHAEPSVVVPALARYSTDTNDFVRSTSATALGEFGTNAIPAVPALLRPLTDPETLVREAATNALKNIDAEAATKAGVK